MTVSEICTLCLLSSFVIVWLVATILRYRVEMTHAKNFREVQDDYSLQIAKGFEQMIDLHKETICALAMQKSLILFRDPETGEYTLRALDTASKALVREWIDRCREQATEAEKEENK